MADRSFAAVRSRASIGPAFPDRPTLPAGGACDGIALVGARADDLSALRGLRDHVAGIWQGDLAGDPGVRVLVAAFDRPVRIDAADLPAALPLIRIGERLASYVSGGGPPRSARSDAAPRRLDLWWSGEARDVALDALAPVPLAMLWDLPGIVVHRATASAARGRRSPPPGEERAAVATARIPMREKPIAAFDETDRALEALHERTRLRAIFRQMLSSWLPTRLVGNKPDDRSDGDPEEPGVLENLVGWVRWHTPLGKGLTAAFGDRMRLVEKLMQSGDVDSALKLALKLGNPGDKVRRTLYPNRLPGMRGSLDFNIGSGGFSMPILGGATFDNLRIRYIELANSLEHQGDFRRAAYIRAQLLWDHHNAVLTLERGGLFADAARLAMDAKLSPALYIRLFYKAGELDTALALARRAGCFDALAEDSKDHSEFHAYVLKAWTELLVATGQHLRALQVTDEAADGADTDTALIDLRKAWLHAAIEASDGSALSGELTVRALLSGDWSERDFTAFPYMPRMGDGPAEDGLEGMQALVRHEVARPGEETVDCLSAIMRLMKPGALEQRSFWSGPAQIVIEAFARATVEAAPAGMIQREIGALIHLLRHAALEVLAADMAKLRNLHAAPAASSDEWILPPPPAVASPVMRACLLHNGNMVVSRQNSLMQLLDRHGAVLWQGNVGDVEALVAVGSGPNVIVVQSRAGDPGGSRRLTRFATNARSFHPIGTLDLSAFHDVTSDGQWMVQVGGQVGALDLVKLCAQTPAVELLWSCALTAAVRAHAFYHDPNSPSWITISAQRGREGVIEKWMLTGRELTTQIARPLKLGRDTGIVPPSAWWWGGLHAAFEDLRSEARLPFVAWTEKEEREIAGMMADRRQLYPAADAFQSGDFSRGRVICKEASEAEGTGTSRTVLTAAGQRPAAMTIQHDVESPLRCVSRGTRLAPNTRGGDLSSMVLLADAHGRILRVDLAAKSVAIL